MNLILQGIAWLFDGANWVDTESPGLGSELVGQLGITAASVALAAIVAIPLGIFIGHTGRGRRIAILSSNTARALPTLGLFSAVVVYLTLQPDWLSPVLPLAVLGVPPLLAGVYAGIESVDKQTLDAARSMGMTEWQVIVRVELPLGLPLVLGGLRATVLQVVATATLASFYGFTTLGLAILAGPASNDYVQMIGGSLLVTVVALLLDGAFALLQRLSEPRGVSRGSRSRTTTARGTGITTTPAGTPVN